MINSKKIIIIAISLAILLMAIGYSAFATQLTLNGTAEIIGEWNVKITNIEAKDISEGVNAGEPEYTNTSATFSAKLNKPGDSVTYEITIKNSGTIDATLGNVQFKPDEEHGSSAIKYTTTDPAGTLLAGDTTTFTVKVEYDKDTTEVPEVKTKTITGIIEYEQK